MQESKGQPLIKLPSRNILLNSKTTVYNLMSNAVRIHVIKQNPPLHICILKMHTVPQYSKLSCKQEIRKYIEAKLKTTFRMLIRPSENMIITTDRFEVKEKMIKIVYGNIPIELWLYKVSSFNFCEKTNSSQSLKFINSIINSILKQNKYSSNNKNNLFFKPILNTVLISNIFKIQGFSTSLSYTKNDILLFLKDSKKYISSKTILEEINEFYYKTKELQKQQRRILLNNFFKNKQIMCQYGKNKIYVLQHFVFDISINSIWFSNGKMKVYLKSYYYDKYNLVIESCNQPLIKVYGLKESFFIPEFMCRILKNDQLKQMQEKSGMKLPSQSLDLQHQHNNQILSLLKGSASFPTFLNYQDLNITIQEALIKMKGVALQYPTIRTAKGQIIDIFQGRTFQFQGKSVFQCGKDLNICIICPTSIDLNQLKKDVIIATDQIGVNHNLVVYTYGLVSSQQLVETIKQMIYIQQQTKRKHPTNIYWILLPQSCKNIYSPLKRITLDQSIRAITQITLTNTFYSTQRKKIMISIIQQMVAKIQGKLWIVENKFKDSNILMIGIYSKTLKKGETILSFCSNKDPQISQFNSRFCIHNDGFNISQHIRAIVMQAIQLYLQVSKSFPEEIIILRNQHQFNDLQQNKEIQQIREGIKNYYIFKPNKPGISYLTVKQIKYLKLSLIKSDAYSRPFHGLLVSTEIVAHGDFILVNELLDKNLYVYFRKLYSKSMISFDQMAELLYHQSFNYYNFQGGVCFPAILRYAQKQANFISKLEHLISLDHLSNLLYFL